ncbi:MAG: cupin domain-containing protein [Haliea sp.]|jgi:quercetin dioxygenase-like cupin family protein|nr:cupin domain-containing protein [Haliea sp.]
MSATPFVKSTEERPRPLNAVGEQITVLASNQETQGYEIFLQEGPEGTGPVAHSHDWDESFFVIDGKVHFGLGEEELIANSGALVHIPGKTEHWFRFGEGGATMLSITGEGSNASVFFMDLDAALPDGAVDYEKIRVVADRNSVRFS